MDAIITTDQTSELAINETGRLDQHPADLCPASLGNDRSRRVQKQAPETRAEILTVWPEHVKSDEVELLHRPCRRRMVWP